eukprot:SM000379S14409  [mRNA]  locus=s379:3558:9411:+ [translate_table: standard]
MEQEGLGPAHTHVSPAEAVEKHLSPAKGGRWTARGGSTGTEHSAPLHSGTYTFFPAAPAGGGHHSPPRLHFWVEESAKAAQLDPGLPEEADGEGARAGGPPDHLLTDELDVPLYDRSTDVTLEASTWSALGTASRSAGSTGHP